jgi:2-C-methyl-D-erythritol 4-phosphate cytidylyltransferase
MPRVGVVIAAGGRGKRLGSRVPKQFLPLAGIPILQRTVVLFASLRSVDEIVITSPKEYIPRLRRLLERVGCRKILSIVAGGKERQDSVWNGLHGFISEPDIVLVHDAVRPLVSRKTVNEVIASATSYGAAVVGVRVQDTIKVEGKKGFYTRTLDRANLRAVQTPQGFAFDILMRAHKNARRSAYLGTDDASLVERMNMPVRIVNGDQRNIKITTSLDLCLAEMWLKQGRSSARTR